MVYAITIFEYRFASFDFRFSCFGFRISIFQFLFSNFHLLISNFRFGVLPTAYCLLIYAARARLAGRLEWKPLTSALEISSRWIWLVPS